MPNLIDGLAAAETITVFGYYATSNGVSSFESYDGQRYIRYYCENCDTMEAQLDLGTSVWICATCDLIRGNTVSNCKLTDDTKSVKCSLFYRFESSSTSIYGKCVKCPSGKTMFSVHPKEYAIKYYELTHTNTTSCDYCFDTNYLPTPDADKCVVCPDSGKTDGDGHLGITRCYITTIPDDGADESGTYIYNRDTDKCYHD